MSKGDNIDDIHHLVRNVSWARLAKDPEDCDRVIGVLPEAFLMREDEEFLSATWAEYFGLQERGENIAQAIVAIRNSRRRCTPKSAFAVGNVREIKEACEEVSRRRIRIVHEPEEDNLAHSAVRQFDGFSQELLARMADTAWSEFILNSDIPV